MRNSADVPCVIVLGYGSLYHHSYEPNARYVKHFDEGYLEFVASRAIEPGGEVTVHYGGDPTSQVPLWFKPEE